MKRLTLLASLIAGLLVGPGCDHLKSPQRIKDLEARVDELSDVVSDMKGEPVGKRKDHEEAKDEDEEAAADEEAEDDSGSKKKSKDEKKDKGKKKKVADDEEDAGSERHAKHEDKGDKEDHGKDEEEPAPRKPHEAAHWSYEGKTGPEHWGDLDEDYQACAAGGQQSPIDIEPKKGSAAPIDFAYQPTAATIVDNGHTLQVNLAPGSSISIDGHRYELVQFHVHTPSEHTVAGERYPLEVHLVHKDADGKLAVVGVLFDVGEASKPLAAVWKKWPKEAKKDVKLGAFDPTGLLPDRRTAYHYEGSLTTPPCSEGVSWNVMRRTRTESPANIALFQKHYENNARPVMPLGDREIQ